MYKDAPTTGKSHSIWYIQPTLRCSHFCWPRTNGSRKRSKTYIDANATALSSKDLTMFARISASL